jgi:hypothetical protein
MSLKSLYSHLLLLRLIADGLISSAQILVLYSENLFSKSQKGIDEASLHLKLHFLNRNLETAIFSDEYVLIMNL